MSDLTKLLEVAGGMGVEPARLTAALEVARRRDAGLAATLAAAAAAPAFDAPGFTALVERGQLLGLKVRGGGVLSAGHTAAGYRAGGA